MKNYRIADIHMHCIPEVDDGAADVKRLKDMGCLIQINAYSVVDETDTRIRELVNGVAEIYKRCRKEYADMVCWKNAESLGQGDGSVSQ